MPPLPQQFRLSVRPFVRLSVTRVLCVKTAEHIIDILSPLIGPSFCFFVTKSCCANGFTPNGGTEYKGVAIFDQYAAISRKQL